MNDLMDYSDPIWSEAELIEVERLAEEIETARRLNHSTFEAWWSQLSEEQRQNLLRKIV